MKRVFGYQHLGHFFQPLFEIHETGFTYRGQPYIWRNVKSVWSFHAWNRPWTILLSMMQVHPYTLVRLTDGTRFWIKGRYVQEQGKPPKVDFFSSVSDAYQELVQIFRAHVAQQGVYGLLPQARVKRTSDRGE